MYFIFNYITMSKTKEVKIYAVFGITYSGGFLKQDSEHIISEEVYKEIKDAWLEKRGGIRLVKETNKSYENKADKK